MKFAKPLAKVLVWIARFFAILYLASAFYALITVIFQTPSFVTEENGKYFLIRFPFSEAGFLRGENYARYIFEMISCIGLYGLFLWLLSNFFDSFRQPRLFTASSVRRLKTLYLCNFIIPPFYLIIHIATGDELSLLIILTGLHAVLGIFAYFMSVIFRQGLNLQQEQDLII